MEIFKKRTGLVIVVILILSFFIGFSAITQSNVGFNDAKRAEYIITIANNVTFPNSDFQSFAIGVLSSDTNLVAILKQKVADGLKIQDKPVVIKQFSNVETIGGTQVLYVNKASNVSLDAVYKRINGTHTLLLSENYEYNTSMFNFIVVDGKRYFELDEQRLANELLVVNPMLAVQGITSKEDWQRLFQQMEKNLAIEREKVQKQQAEITQQKADIEKQTQTISQQTQTISSQQTEITIQDSHIKKQDVQLRALNTAVVAKEQELNEKNIIIEQRKKQIDEQAQFLEQQKGSIAAQKMILSEQKNQIVEQKNQMIAQLSQISMQRMLLWLFVVLFIVVVVAGYFVVKAYRIKKQANTLLLNKNQEILAQNKQITEQRDQIAHQNKEIRDSILYARRIQTAVLPPDEIIQGHVHDHFILYKPRDIVSGDYYWMTQVDEKIVVVAADCTGHGVPGAFMSLLGVTFLNEIVNQDKVLSTDEILNRQRACILKSLNREGREETKDGMDMSVCLIDCKAMRMEFSGAYNPLYIIRKGELIEVKADRMPVGLSLKNDVPFTKQDYALEKDDVLYMFSDGYVDQFGGPENKKYMARRFKDFLLQIHQKPMSEQRNLLDQNMIEWRNGTEQIDDILVVGIKV